jgi:hypothetical protein
MTMARRSPNGSIRSTLDQHATAIATLTTEVHGIKSAIAGQDRKLDKLFDVIRETQQKAGPGIKETLMLTVAAAGLVGAVAGAITVLVVSIVQPAQARLETRQASFESRVDRLEGAAWQEYQDLKREERKRMSWAPQVKAN